MQCAIVLPARRQKREMGVWFFKAFTQMASHGLILYCSSFFAFLEVECGVQSWKAEQEIRGMALVIASLASALRLCFSEKYCVFLDSDSLAFGQREGKEKDVDGFDMKNENLLT